MTKKLIYMTFWTHTNSSMFFVLLYANQNYVLLQTCKFITTWMDWLDQFEQEREHVASSVECVMMEKEVSEEEAREELRKMVAYAWKEVNKGLLRPFPHPLPILLPTLGLARTGKLFYRHKDAYTNATGETKDNVVSLFIEPFHV